MSNIFTHPYNVQLYKERAEFEEFGHAQKGFQLCPICRAFNYNKSWHHLSILEVSKVKKSGRLRISRCPACKMIMNNQYEGLLKIDNIPGKFIRELENLIRS